MSLDNVIPMSFDSFVTYVSEQYDDSSPLTKNTLRSIQESLNVAIRIFGSPSNLTDHYDYFLIKRCIYDSVLTLPNSIKSVVQL